MNDNQRKQLDSLLRIDKPSEEDKETICRLQRLSYKTRPVQGAAQREYQGPTVEETMSRIEKDFGK